MTSIYRHFVATFSFLVVLFGVGGTVAHAIPASFDPNNPSTTILYDVVNGVAEFSATVSYDDAAGPWIKEIVINDESFGNGQGLPAGSSITLIEHLTVDGPRPWTDWHEVIVEVFLNDPNDTTNYSDFFSWGAFTVEIVDNGVPSPLGHTFELTDNDRDLSLEFDRLVGAGTELLLTKELILANNAPFPEPFEGSIFIEEYPTVDEPAAMMVFGFGLVALGLARRRWSRRAA